jgi:hypothetical protein
MRKRRVGAIAGVLAAVCLVGAPSASAATEFGDNCVANGGAPTYTFVSLSAVGDPLPLTAPISGVITQWKSNLGPTLPPSGLSAAMTVVRPTGGPLQFTVVGQSATSPLTLGLNVFPARIPVLAGDRIGLTGAFAPVYCQTGNPADVMGIIPQVVGPGSTVTLKGEPGYRTPVSAVLEPDADHDGFGDETQDLCPQSAAFQTACPPVSVDASTVVKKGSVLVLVSVDSGAPVTVIGTAKLGKGKVAKLSGGTQTAAPGKITRFTLKFSKKLKDKLEGLSPKQRLTLKVTASATNVAGLVSTDKLKVKLKGQG